MQSEKGNCRKYQEQHSVRQAAGNRAEWCELPDWEEVLKANPHLYRGFPRSIHALISGGCGQTSLAVAEQRRCVQPTSVHTAARLLLFWFLWSCPWKLPFAFQQLFYSELLYFTWRKHWLHWPSQRGGLRQQWRVAICSRVVMRGEKWCACDCNPGQRAEQSLWEATYRQEVFSLSSVS